MSGIDWRRVATTALGVLAGSVATVGTLAVAVAGFTLSYDAIRKVGIAAGIRPDWAWLLPVSIDGAMAVGTVTAVVMRRMERSVWYPWAVVLAGAGISIACNALHATMRDHIQLDDNTAMAVSAIPAAMLALSVHLLVVLIDAAAQTLGEPDTRPVCEPAPVADTAPVDPDVAALCDEILSQARRARHEISRSLLWQPAPMALPPIAHAEPVRTAVIEATTVPEPVSTAAEKPTGTRTAEHKKARTDAKKPRTGTPTKVRTAKKTGTRTDDELIAALAGVPRELDGTVPVRRAASALGTGPDRARKLLATAGLLRTGIGDTPTQAPATGPASTTANGHAVGRIPTR